MCNHRPGQFSFDEARHSVAPVWGAKRRRASGPPTYPASSTSQAVPFSGPIPFTPPGLAAAKQTHLTTPILRRINEATCLVARVLLRPLGVSADDPVV